MIIIHDLIEAEAKDVSALDVLRNPDIRKQKVINEQKAIENIRSMLKETNGQEIYDLWYEFELKKTYEAKVANAMDKLEVQLQHNHADLTTWEEIEYEMTYLITKHTDFDETVDLLKELIVEDAEQKLFEVGIDIVEVKKRASERLKN